MKDLAAKVQDFSPFYKLS